jgi:hypothetical protein
MRFSGTDSRMKTMFVIWATLIVGGIAFYAVIGLTHG